MANEERDARSRTDQREACEAHRHGVNCSTCSSSQYCELQPLMSLDLDSMVTGAFGLTRQEFCDSVAKAVQDHSDEWTPGDIAAIRWRALHLWEEVHETVGILDTMETANVRAWARWE